jgi:ketosteroid isomerase-like protein
VLTIRGAIVNFQAMTADTELKQTLLVRENEWMSAWQRRDRAAAEEIVADEFMLVSSLGGEVFSKAQWMDAAMGPMRCESFRFDDIRIFAHGDTAVVVCWYQQAAQARGTPWNGRFVMTDVWIFRASRWQVVTRHATWLDAPPAEAVQPR